MILDLVAAGRKVGVTANSHKVIGKLLDEVIAASHEHDSERARGVRVGQKPGDEGELTCADAVPLKSNAAVREGHRLRQRGCGRRHRLATSFVPDSVDVSSSTRPASLATTPSRFHLRLQLRWSCSAIHSSSTSH
jgi:hypothetical protein